MMHSKKFQQAAEIIRKKVILSPEPMTREIIFLYGKDPYLILVSCLLSLQCRDSVTLPVSKKLFTVAKTPQQILDLPRSDLESLIKSINYYKTKSARIQQVSAILLDRFDGKVPRTREELLSLPGVGIKTANLVLAEAYDIPAICVDTHVHRLSNHWNVVHTQTPEQTERELCKILPQSLWKEWNYLLVRYGQFVCKTKRCLVSECDMITQLLQQHSPQ